MEESQSDRFAIRLLAALLILAGVGSVTKIVYEAFNDSFRLDLGFLGIPIGKGLLERKDAWRKGALLVVWLGLISAPIISVVLFFVGPGDPMTIAGVRTDWVMPKYAFWLLCAGCFAFFFWQLRVLTRPEVTATFTGSGTGRNTWWIAIALVSLLVSVTNYISFHFFGKLLRTVDHHAAIIYLVDADTGARLNPITHTEGSGPRDVLPKVSLNSRGTGDGNLAVEVSWLAAAPITLGVSSNGYGRRDITLGPDDDMEKITVRLKRGALEPDDADPSAAGHEDRR